MQGIRIRDLDEDNYLVFDLKEVLSALGQRALKSEWRCSVEEFLSSEDDYASLESAYNSGRRIAGNELYGMAERTHQVIYGVFEAFEPGGEAPWVRVEAVDSSFCEVFSLDRKVLAAVSTAFNTVERVEDEAS